MSQRAEMEEGSEPRIYPGMDHLASNPWHRCSSKALTCFQLFHPGFRNHRNTEWFGLGWKGPERPCSSTTAAMGREPSTGPGDSEPIQPVWSTSPSLHPWLSRFWHHHMMSELPGAPLTKWMVQGTLMPRPWLGCALWNCKTYPRRVPQGPIPAALKWSHGHSAYPQNLTPLRESPEDICAQPLGQDPTCASTKASGTSVPCK